MQGQLPPWYTILDILEIVNIQISEDEFIVVNGRERCP